MICYTLCSREDVIHQVTEMCKLYSILQNLKINKVLAMISREFAALYIQLSKFSN